MVDKLYELAGERADFDKGLRIRLINRNLLKGGQMPSLASNIDGKKYMWDKAEYATEAEAKEKIAAYEKKGFEAACLTEEGKYLVYTRKVITEITLE